MQQHLQHHLQMFLSQHTPKAIKIHSQIWNYYDIGRGKETIIIFPDIMGTYESWFEYIPMLSRSHRVIIPFYPSIAHLDEMITSLHLFVLHLHLERYSLIGTSLGGLFAQEYIRQFPWEVKQLLLIATGTADSFFGVITAILFAAGNIVPEIAIKWFVYFTAQLSLSLNKKQKHFWKQYLKDQIWKVNTKPFMLAWGTCVLELCWKKKYTSGDLKKWNQPIYLIESNNDFIFNPITRAHLRSIYPQALCYTLRGANHLIWINRFDEVSDILRKFTL